MNAGVVTFELDQASALVEADDSKCCHQSNRDQSVSKQEAKNTTVMQQSYQPGNEDVVIEATLELPSTTQHAHTACHEIAARFEWLNYNEREVIAARTAVYEALSNAIQHGNSNDPSKRLTVSYRIDHLQCVISIQDEGDGFDPASLPDPTLDENVGSECAGRGWLIMRHFMSDIEIRKPGNCVVLTLLRGKKW